MGTAMRILLVDDHAVVREGLRNLLERAGFAVVGEAGDGREALALAEKLRPEVAVIDLAMPALNGLGTLKRLRAQGLPTKSILLTCHTERQYVVAAFEAGASGYVIKTQATADLVQALHEVERGGTYVSPMVPRDVVEAVLAHRPVRRDPLSPREREVLQLVAEGRSTKDVAKVLGVSVKTAETHRTRLMAKLDIHDTAGLVHYAIREGLVLA